MYETITTKNSKAEITVTLNNPPLNIMTIKMISEITMALEQLESDVKVLVFRGEGKCFSAGADVKEHKREFLKDFMTAMDKLFITLHNVKIPTVSAVHGMALGGGFELATFCDLTYASQSAKLGQPEIKLGVFAPIAAALFPSIIGSKRCYDILLSGRTMTANEAQSFGLVNDVFSDEKLFPEVDKIANSLSELSLPALVACKKAIRKVSDSAFVENLTAIESIYADETMRTEDALEGINSFLEKRKPVWRNR